MKEPDKQFNPGLSIPAPSPRSNIFKHNAREDKVKIISLPIPFRFTFIPRLFFPGSHGVADSFGKVIEFYSKQNAN
jgi:hypothetical protein